MNGRSGWIAWHHDGIVEDAEEGDLPPHPLVLLADPPAFRLCQQALDVGRCRDDYQ